MSDVSGEDYAERIFWSDFDGLRAFTEVREGGDVLAEYIRVDVVQEMLKAIMNEARDTRLFDGERVRMMRAKAIEQLKKLETQ